MKTLKFYSRKGFTIIEVVLVLAIAGLIFLMIFIALPALQRSQRDTQRKNNLALIADGYTRFKANNPNTNINGIFGDANNTANTIFARVIIDYVNVDGYNMTDPSGRPYVENGRFVGPSLAYYGQFGLHFHGNKYNLWEGARRFENGGQTFYNSIGFVGRAKCSDDEAFDRAGSNNAAIFVGLEGGGLYCVDI